MSGRNRNQITVGNSHSLEQIGFLRSVVRVISVTREEAKLLLGVGQRTSRRGAILLSLGCSHGFNPKTEVHALMDVDLIGDW